MSVTQRREIEREDHVGLGKAAAKNKIEKNEDPLPFLKKPSSTRPPLNRYGSEVDTHPTRKNLTTSGPMDSIFQQEVQEEVDLTIAFFFYVNFI